MNYIETNRDINYKQNGTINTVLNVSVHRSMLIINNSKIGILTYTPMDRNISINNSVDLDANMNLHVCENDTGIRTKRWFISHDLYSDAC